MRRVLITGGAGFIGSHLAEHYLAAGAEVVVVDDLSTGRLDNLRRVEGAPRLEVRIADVCDPSWTPLIERCDVVFHLAARVGLKLVVENPLGTLETNVDGTANVLRAAERSRTKVIVASTSEVYGLASRYPSSEADPIAIGSAAGTRWSYAASKAIDEFIALGYWRERGVPTVVARLFNTVGPRQTGRYGMVIPRFVDQAIANEPLTVYGDGTQTRSFCHVRDTVHALARLAEEPAAVGEIVNVGNPQETTINDLAARVIAIAGSRSTVDYVPFAVAYDERFEEIARRVPDIAKLRTLVGFRPSADLDAILRDVVAERTAKTSEEVAA